MTSRSASGRAVLQARELFLEGGSALDGAVRDEIRASWLRSRQHSIGAEHVQATYVERADPQTLLRDSAMSVLRDVAQEIANEPVALLLTDPHGVVLDRVCGDRGLTQHLDRAQLSLGFTYAESSVGTNGIGTAIETRSPTLVTGGEHFVGDLCQFGCAGVPIVHPLTSALVGLLDLTSWARDTNPMLLGYARATARRIQDRMVERTSLSEVTLVREYLWTCQHAGGSVLALNGELTMMNAHLQQTFDAADQTTLLACVADVSEARRTATVIADLPSGQVVRLGYRPTFTEQNAFAGGIVQIKPQVATRTHEPRHVPAVRLPGVVGASPTWERVCQKVLDSQRRSEWLVLEGEPGVGKLTLLTGAHRAAHPTGHLRVLDAADAYDIDVWLDEVAEELDAQPNTGTLILRRVHLLPESAVSSLAGMLLECQGNTGIATQPWVTMTMPSAAHSATIDAELLPHFPHTIAVPALRHHMDDLPRLVAHLLGQISRDSRLALSDDAMNQFMRLPWHGNVKQLRKVLTEAARQRRTGIIGVDDLPPECRSVNRRRLTTMEALERDAIVDALDTHDGNKDLAAEALGMSRATIYRKIKGFGIRSR
ncbi:sigma-54-dependent Fis family transcriptional regulator [Leekyejoonella antrihumi]|uniref:Fis family transcriptional regulator n=1 Tax=Leekyejoonella antrihumi TaxID=1660198 RepID=A0A563E140_9MICO|nr:helix-turn-helix domain-containing protein [Leekyejoonella antrihumi]TWP35614.1 Fis family transcriptional regulator [Leekyejoonella antrihumi]